MLSQELPPNPTTDYNWISSISYNIEGVTLSKGVNYFNDLGKSTQSQSWDINNNLVWGSQTLYDYHGRSALQTLSAPLTSGSYFEFDYQLIMDNTGLYNYEDFDQGYFIENPKMVSTNSKLGSYYFNNSSNAYQDNTNYPFSRTVYSKLNPGVSIGILGGNKINGEWKQSYSFAMPAGTELSTSQAFGNNKMIYDEMRVLKTVSRDIHGIEVVVFTDGEGNVLAAARSGNEEQASTPIINTLTIKEQGYVDIHIPVGCTGITVTNPQNIDLKIFDLITEEEVVTTTFVLDPGFYRVAVEYPETYIYNESNPIVIKHTVNYYDYALNYYDYAGRLLRSEQPKSGLSTFVYNSLGQLQSTSNTDEGKAKFIYRKDGQIRFSQNDKQQENTEFSYTNYDKQGRPIESGVYTSDDILFSLTPFEPVENTTPTYSSASIAPANIVDVAMNSNADGITYIKEDNNVTWNAGFDSQGQFLQENGYLTFKYGFAQEGPSPMFGDYNVMVGLSPADAVTDPNYESIKYAFNLRQESGDANLHIRIYENGDFVRDANGQIRTFGTFTESSKFKIKREDGYMFYYKGNSLVHTSNDTYIEPLKIDVSFKYTTNAVSKIFLYNEELAPPTPDLGTDIHTLVDVIDGLDDGHCIEQTFTLYDVADMELPNILNQCGIPNEHYKQTFLSGNVSKTYTKNPKTNTT
ncbi:hypothetical protein, partial [Xanthomarina gelatinilytica]|uniref:hypothetical protein n=1 Tax=Xanthomarina gelatinilytica TaxID=1137281 RepID=UPI003AA93BD1